MEFRSLISMFSKRRSEEKNVQYSNYEIFITSNNKIDREIVLDDATETKIERY